MFDDLRRRYVDSPSRGWALRWCLPPDDFSRQGPPDLATEPQFIAANMTTNASGWTAGEPPQTRAGGHDWWRVRWASRRNRRLRDRNRHFTGNYPPGAEIEVCRRTKPIPATTQAGRRYAAPETSRATTAGLVSHRSRRAVTHVRLHISPTAASRGCGSGGGCCPTGRSSAPTRRGPAGDGQWRARPHSQRRALCWMRQLTAPGRASTWGDGWETRRRREPGS